MLSAAAIWLLSPDMLDTVVALDTSAMMQCVGKYQVSLVSARLS